MNMQQENLGSIVMKIEKRDDGLWIDIKYVNFLIEAFDFHSAINSTERAELYLYNLPKLREVIVKIMDENSEIERMILISENRHLLNVTEEQRSNWKYPYKIRKENKTKRMFARLNKPWKD